MSSKCVQDVSEHAIEVRKLRSALVLAWYLLWGYLPIMSQALCDRHGSTNAIVVGSPPRDPRFLAACRLQKNPVLVSILDEFGGQFLGMSTNSHESTRFFEDSTCVSYIAVRPICPRVAICSILFSWRQLVNAAPQIVLNCIHAAFA